jgi:site-specific DNA-methyltransferase (adenine-specific)
MTALCSLPSPPVERVLDRVLHGDCVELMKHLPDESVDFVLTDPPYLVRYRDRSGRSLLNDDSDAWLEPAFAQMYRLLKLDSFLVSFYGWDAVDRFVGAWRGAGFQIAGHIVFEKPYASSIGYLERRHEQAYLLVKGRPRRPVSPLPDVLGWSYTGNRLHPTQKPVSILKPLIESFSAPGAVILDPFCGSGSTLAAARSLGRPFVGMELDPVHHRTSCDRLDCPAG